MHLHRCGGGRGQYQSQGARLATYVSIEVHAHISCTCTTWMHSGTQIKYFRTIEHRSVQRGALAGLSARQLRNTFQPGFSLSNTFVLNVHQPLDTSTRWWLGRLQIRLKIADQAQAYCPHSLTGLPCAVPLQHTVLSFTSRHPHLQILGPWSRRIRAQSAYCLPLCRRT